MSTDPARPSNVVSLSERQREAARRKPSDLEAYHNAVIEQLKAKEEAIIMSFGF